MKVGIVVVAGTPGLRPVDLLRAEGVAGAVRDSGHAPRCVAVRAALEAESFTARLDSLDAHVVVYYAPVEVAADVTRLTECGYAQAPKRPQFLVGPWPTIDPEAAIKGGPINGLLRGECDLTLGRLLNALSDREALKQVPGLWLRRGGGSVHQVDPGAPPPPEHFVAPDFEGFDWPALAPLLRNTAPIEASRGTVYPGRHEVISALRRAYATIEDAHYYRLRPVADVMRDVEAARRRFEPLRLLFVDDVFPFEAAWLDQFLARHAAETSLPFGAFLAAELHAGEVLARLAASGLTDCHLNLVCGDPEVRAQLSPLNRENDQVRALVREAQARGVRTIAHVVVGLPGETREHMARTEQFLRSGGFDAVSVTTYSPIPGSELYDALVAQGRIDRTTHRLSDSMARSSAGRMDIAHFADKIHRLNLEKQAATYRRKRGYFSMIENIADANHKVRNLESLTVQRRRGESAFLHVVPAESAFTVFVQPGSVLTGAVELPGAGPDQTQAGAVQLDITFSAESGAGLTLFSARLGSRGSGDRAEFNVPVQVPHVRQGTITLVARDAGGGEGVAVAWIDPVLEAAPGTIPPRGDSRPARPAISKALLDETSRELRVPTPPTDDPPMAPPTPPPAPSSSPSTDPTPTVRATPPPATTRRRPSEPGLRRPNEQFPPDIEAALAAPTFDSVMPGSPRELPQLRALCTELEHRVKVSHEELQSLRARVRELEERLARYESAEDGAAHSPGRGTPPSR